MRSTKGESDGLSSSKIIMLLPPITQRSRSSIPQVIAENYSDNAGCSRRRLCGLRSRLPREWCAPGGLAGPWSRLDGRDGAGDGRIPRQEDLLAVMVHLQRRAVELAVRRLLRGHFYTQAASTEL